MKRVLIILLLGLAAFAQSPQRGTYGGAAGKPPGTQGAVFAIPNAAGSQATTFEYLFDVTPAAVSITIQGCMRGTSTQPGNVGTCDAAADTYAGTTNSIRNPAFTKVYDTFLITIGTLSAGTTLTVNTTIVVSKAGTAGGAASGVASVSGAAPITSTGGANPTIGCATCATTAAGTTNVLAKYTSASALGNSSITDNGTVVTGTEPLQQADGSQSTPAYSFSGATNIGFHRSGNNILADIGGGPQVAFNGAAGLELPAANWMAWSSVTDPTSAPDTTIARTAAKSFKFGAGGDSTGNIQTAAYKTDTNCSAVGTAANPSVASCTAATAGSFSCATNASTGTCTVNTTAVTANSEIFVTGRNDTTTGTRLSVTCNTGITTAIPEISAVVAATSFTINLGTFTTNPECFSYFIVN